MEFFDKVRKKASETFKITKEKATTISEELKIKGKISEAKDKIEDLYKEIGEKVFEELKDGKDVIKEEISEKIEKISDLKNDIEKYQVEILSLKKIKKCSECGEELEINAEFCSKCGKKQDKIEQNPEVKENENIENNPEVKEADVIEVKDTQNSDNNEQNDNN